MQLSKILMDAQGQVSWEFSIDGKPNITIKDSNNDKALTLDDLKPYKLDPGLNKSLFVAIADAYSLKEIKDYIYQLAADGCSQTSLAIYNPHLNENGHQNIQIKTLVSVGNSDSHTQNNVVYACGELDVGLSTMGQVRPDWLSIYLGGNVQVEIMSPKILKELLPRVVAL